MNCTGGRELRFSVCLQVDRPSPVNSAVLPAGGVLVGHLQRNRKHRYDSAIRKILVARIAHWGGFRRGRICMDDGTLAEDTDRATNYCHVR